MTENKKLVIELSNLGPGPMRKTIRELRVVIEDYAWKSMVSECINVVDAGEEVKKESVIL